MPHKRPFFEDRSDAGNRLSERLASIARGQYPLVLALPRGGVPVGAEIAKALQLELDVFLVRKVGMPGQEELALGAIASGGAVVFNEELVRKARLPRGAIDQLTAREEAELQRREALYRGGREALRVADRFVILVDDGLATGATMKAACRALRQQEPRRLIVATPVGAEETCAELRREADEVTCLQTPDPFVAVGVWYRDFSQTTDADVQRLLQEAEARRENTR